MPTSKNREYEDKSTWTQKTDDQAIKNARKVAKQYSGIEGWLHNESAMSSAKQANRNTRKRLGVTDRTYK